MCSSCGSCFHRRCTISTNLGNLHNCKEEFIQYRLELVKLNLSETKIVNLSETKIIQQI